MFFIVLHSFGNICVYVRAPRILDFIRSLSHLAISKKNVFRITEDNGKCWKQLFSMEYGNNLHPKVFHSTCITFF